MNYGDCRSKAPVPMTLETFKSAWEAANDSFGELQPSVVMMGYGAIMRSIRVLGARSILGSRCQFITSEDGLRLVRWALTVPFEYVDYIADRGIE